MSRYASFLVVIFTFIISSLSAATVWGFSTDDLTGTWYGYIAGMDGTQKSFWEYGAMEVDDEGQITRGLFHVQGGGTVTLTGGTMTMDESGLIQGTFLSEGPTTSNILGAKMEKRQGIIGMAATVEGTNLIELATFIKAGGTFAQTDLAGTWRATVALPGLGFSGTTMMGAYGSFIVDEAGNITGGEFNLSDGSRDTVSGGAMTISAEGRLSGTIGFSSGVTATLRDGKMNIDKSLAAIVADSNLGISYFSHMMKTGSAYSSSDFSGQWYTAFGYRADYAAGGQHMACGMIDLDASGALTGGSADTTDGGAFTFQSGNFAIDENGLVTGAFTTSIHGQLQILQGMMDPLKNFFISTGWDINQERNGQYTIFIKAGSSAVTFLRYDFNGDGKPDVLYRHPDTGKAGIWLMDDTTESTWKYIGNHGVVWDIKGVGDFNGDGHNDVLYKHSGGNIGVWLMNGATETTWQYIGNHGAAWDIEGVGDFNGDGDDDLIFGHSDGKVGVWLMNGTTENTWRFIGDHNGGWKVKGVGDFNSDGQNDILYRNSTGDIGVWLMNGTAETTWQYIGDHGADWDVKSVADYNGDGRIDVLYRNSGGNVGAWLMNGVTETSWQYVGNHGAWDIR